MKMYRKEGLVADRPHLNLPDGTFEEELGLEGFFGFVSHIYHRHAPTGWRNLKAAPFQWPKLDETAEEFLKPQCYGPQKQGAASGDFFEASRPLFWNAETAIHIHTITQPQQIYFRNSDASEILFVHQGQGSLETLFGEISFQAGDYLHLPKGVTYRLQTTSAYLLRIESFASALKKPETGILGQQALYHEEGIEGPRLKKPSPMESSSKVWVQKEGRLSEIEYAFDLRDIAGWMGTLYPSKLSVKNIAPILSSVAHLPPSVNATFIAKGFIVCTFLPRPLEEPAGALKVPFFHSNIDYDEIIFYHEGDFFSRDNMEKACITLHPRGIQHGPHPKALKNQHSKTRTDEIAVMVDTEKPLKVTSFGRALEKKEYWKSWGLGEAN